MRLFVAVDVPQSLKEAIETQVVDPLRERVAGAKVSWPRPEGRHLTLKFLGRSVEEDRVDRISDVLRDAARRHAAFDAAFGEVGGFPNLRRPRVLWLGLAEGAEEIAAVAADVDRDLAEIGFEPEDRPFHPHFTLVRFTRPTSREVPEYPVPSDRFEVREITLYESRLHPKGARYTALERFPLGA